MSYKTWTTEGYGCNLTKICKNINGEMLSSLLDKSIRAKETVELYLNSSKNLKNMNAEELALAFEEYEGNDMITIGLEALIADIINEKTEWTPFIEVVIDEFNDNSVYFLVIPIYSWSFANRPDVKKLYNTLTPEIISKQINEIFAEYGINVECDYENIENGG